MMFQLYFIKLKNINEIIRNLLDTEDVNLKKKVFEFLINFNLITNLTVLCLKIIFYYILIKIIQPLNLSQ